MHRLASLALLAAAVGSLAVPGAAFPFTGHFEDLQSELIGRDAGLPVEGLTKEQRRQKAAINKAFNALDADSEDLAGDLVMARKAIGAVEKGFPGDEGFGPILLALNDALAADVDEVRDETVVLISIATEGKLRTRAEAKLAAADAWFIAADEADTQALRARGREKGFKAVRQASVLAVKAGPGGAGDTNTMSAVVAGTPWAANTKFGTGVSGLADVSETNGGLRKVIVSGRQILPLSTNDRLPGETRRIQLTLLSANQDVVVGTYAMGNSNGVNASASWYFEDESEEVSQAVSTGGTIEVTSVTVHLGSVDISGTFTLTMYDGLEDSVFDITSGSFAVEGLPRSTVP